MLAIVLRYIIGGSGPNAKPTIVMPAATAGDLERLVPVFDILAKWESRVRHDRRAGRGVGDEMVRLARSGWTPGTSTPG